MAKAAGIVLLVEMVIIALARRRASRRRPDAVASPAPDAHAA